jgi:hypothetical protein
MAIIEWQYRWCFMRPKNGMGDFLMYIDKQTLKAFLAKISQWPGMYIGENRFDYLRHFVGGAFYSPLWFSEVKGETSPITIFDWQCDYDMQRWLFLKESISIAHSASINGWTIFQLCFGNGRKAIEQFQVMIKEILFSSGDKYERGDTVSSHIWQVYRHYKYSGISSKAVKSYYIDAESEDYYPVSEAIKNTIGEVSYNYESIIPFITRMIKESFSDLRVYLHYGAYFLCVKFMYKSKENVWVENVALANQPDFYYDLVILHAYASIVQQEEHDCHIMYLQHKDDVTTVNNIIKSPASAIVHAEESPICQPYEEWKKTI